MSVIPVVGLLFDWYALKIAEISVELPISPLFSQRFRTLKPLLMIVNKPVKLG